MPLTVVKPEDIIEFDVFGRSYSVGNIRYRNIIKAAVSQFYAAKSAEGKALIAQQVLEDLEPGRMLQFLAKDCFYHHIGDEASLTKVKKDFYNASADMMRSKRKASTKKKRRVEAKNKPPSSGVVHSSRRHQVSQGDTCQRHQVSQGGTCQRHQVSQDNTY